jgi:hypothetical protein
MGRTFAAKASADSLIRRTPAACASAKLVRLPSIVPCAFFAASATRVRSEIWALFLGQRSINMQHERVAIDTELGNDERDPLSHQTGDKRHVAR